MISPLVGAGLSIVAPAAGRAALKLVDQATQTFASVLSATADTLTADPPTHVPATAPSSSAVSIESIKTLSKNLAAEFHRLAIGALEAAGIDTTRDLSLRLGSQGEIVVMGDSTDKPQIEQVLNSGDLPELFNRVTGLQEIAHTYDQRPSFREAFGRDPLSAVAAYSQSHDTVAGVIQLTLNDESVCIDFPAW